ncbi:DUF4440 domain-containing protein [Actinoplanes utahensis]|nr:DUF4440 domain-containing protein [Actinoplanes utahensis]
MEARVDRFLATFSSANEASRPDLLGDCFADSFLSANSSGARPTTRDAFLAALPQRATAFGDAGIGVPELVERTWRRLDEHYLLVRTDWQAPRAFGGAPVALASSFLLHDDGRRLRIVLYLNHEGLPRPTGEVGHQVISAGP